LRAPPRSGKEAYFVLLCGPICREVLRVMDKAEIALYERLKHGPSFLFLGQDYLRIETGRDPLLSEIIRKYGPQNVAVPTYYSLFDGTAAEHRDVALAWMDERCKRISVPDWLRTVTQFAWNGVYTSSIDSILLSAFRSSWREVQPIFEEKFNPSDPRNKRVLHCTFVFGSLNQADEMTSPPLTRFEWTKRKQVAVALARRLPELVTPLGSLFIEGYGDILDWLTPDELLPILDGFSAGQVHFFNVREEFLKNPDFRHLIDLGKITTYEKSLSTILAQGQDLGLITLDTAQEELAGRCVQIAKKSVVVPQDIWVQLSRSAVLVDEGALVHPRPLSEDATYREFRNFLASADGPPQWASFAREFAFRRHFQKDFSKIVKERLSRRALSDVPIILHGQTGTGKTVALGSLAYEVALQREYPVLYIERRSQKPVYSDIDRFCQWSEDAGAQAALIIWDGMMQQEDYSEFLRHLSSRGRKVVLVGSSYRLTEHLKENTVEAPAQLSESELSEFGEFLSGFHPSFRDFVKSAGPRLDQTFLVALYRILPSTRMAIRTGVASEIGHAEELLRKKAAETQVVSRAPTILEEQLRKAGWVGGEQLFSETTKTVGGEILTDIQDFTCLVMVPGRFGLRVPLELLLRTLGRKDKLRIVKLFEGIDIIRWFEDEVGNIEVGPRNALEARLVVDSRLGGPNSEVEFIRRLLLEIHDQSAVQTDGREVTFGVELLRAIGPKGESKDFFSPYFKDVADALKELREERGVENPRLMLQEANLLREWAVGRDRVDPTDANIDKALGEVESVVESAFASLGQDQRNRRLRTFLFNELTASLATRAVRHTSDPLALKKFYEEASAALQQARRQDPDSYYPIDILSWFARDMIGEGVLDSEGESELLADVLSSFQVADSMELDVNQQIMLQKRRMEIAGVANLKDVEESAFAALEAKGSCAGFYLRALRISGLPEAAEDPRKLNIMRLDEALGYLRSQKEKISGDARCLELLFDLWWIVTTGRRLFASERIAVPLSSEQWAECLGLVEGVEATGESKRPLVMAFVRGLALFHLGRLELAFQTFRELDRESERVMGRRRIVRSYIASTPSGAPQKFHGTVAWVAHEGIKGSAHVEELRRQIDFRPRDFGKPDITSRTSLGEFHIAFNFVGPIADPTSYYKS
jgi:hypothetical protein